MRFVSVLLLALVTVLAPLTAAATPAPADASGCKPHKLKFSNWPTWYAPNPASPTDANMQLGLIGLSAPFRIMSSAADRKLLDVKAGFELPLIVFDGDDVASIKQGCWGMGFWIPWDLGLTLSYGPGQPPLDNDYRLGGEIKIAYGLTANNQLYMLALIGHESDHLPDEAIQLAFKKFPQFKPVDVNFEYMRAGISWDHEYTHSKITNRFSYAHTLDIGHKGYYSLDERGFGRVLPSTRNGEITYGLIYAWQAKEGWRPYVAYDAELNAIYNYHKTDPNQIDSVQISQHFVLALRHFGGSNFMVPDPYIKLDLGRNPFGQFRDQVHYRLIETGLTYHF